MIESIHLRVQDPAEQVAFYRDQLGMTDFGSGLVGYEGAGQARLAFDAGSAPYAYGGTDLYWKIALAVPDLELACRQLAERGVSNDGPRQFRDIGYLAHIADPEGFKIELIQHTFEGDESPIPSDPNLLGGGPSLNLLTLRASEIAPVDELCRSLGMTPLSVQPVESYNFTLYFYAFTEERPPNVDLEAVENRPWLYQRPYTVLEIQHQQAEDTVVPTPPDRAGFIGFRADVKVPPEAPSLIGLLPQKF